MAENVQLMTLNARYYCYICHREVSIFQSAELICPNCSSDFLEEVSEDCSREIEDDEDISDTENDELGLIGIQRLGTLFNRLTHLADDEDDYEDPEDAEGDLQEEEELEPEHNDVARFRGVIQNLGMENIDEIQQLESLQSFLSVFLNEDIDDISTMLLNEPDSSGPPPLPIEQIKLLPTIIVSKEMIDKKVQCTVCMEDFNIRERVKMLACEHCFHEKCITPWLEMHATCPNCRVVIEAQEPKNQRSRSWPRSDSNSSNASSRDQSSYSEATSSLTNILSSSGPFQFL